MREVECKHTYDEEGHVCWKCMWKLISSGSGHSELLIRGRGSEYRVVTGECSTGRYLCIPSCDIGCCLAELSDVFWNTERLAGMLGVIDAVTIATALMDYGRNR